MRAAGEGQGQMLHETAAPGVVLALDVEVLDLEGQFLKRHLAAESQQSPELRPPRVWACAI